MTTVEWYLWINAAMYAGFAGWCLLKPTGTAAFSGLALMNSSGRSEYFALYVGLEFAWALMYIICALHPSMQFAGVFYSLFLYGGVIAGRWISIFQKGVSSKNTYFIAALEIIFLIWSIVLYTRF